MFSSLFNLIGDLSAAFFGEGVFDYLVFPRVSNGVLGRSRLSLLFFGETVTS